MDERAFDRLVERLQQDQDGTAPTLRQIVAALAGDSSPITPIRPFIPPQCAAIDHPCIRKRCCHRARCEQHRCRCAGNDKPCGGTCIRRDKCCRDANCPAGSRCAANNECVSVSTTMVPLAPILATGTDRVRRLAISTAGRGSHGRAAEPPPLDQA